MKKTIATTIVLFGIASQSWAGVGTGKVLDVTLRAYDNLLVVKVQNTNSLPGCASWYHTFGKRYDGPVTVALQAMLLSAQASGNTVHISGSGNCLAGTGTEEILEVNIGSWLQ